MLPKIDNCPWIAAMLTDNDMDHFLDCVKQYYKINVNEKKFSEFHLQFYLLLCEYLINVPTENICMAHKIIYSNLILYDVKAYMIIKNEEFYREFAFVYFDGKVIHDPSQVEPIALNDMLSYGYEIFKFVPVIKI